MRHICNSSDIRDVSSLFSKYYHTHLSADYRLYGSCHKFCDNLIDK